MARIFVDSGVLLIAAHASVPAEPALLLLKEPAHTDTYCYAVSADGKRFLIIVPLEEALSTPITVVLNWAAGGKQ